MRDPSESPLPRVSEEAAASLAEHGVRASVVRLPASVHGLGDHGFVPRLIGIAREKGRIGVCRRGPEPLARSAPPLDAASLYRLVLERGGGNGSVAARYHGIAEESVPFQEIARVIGRRLNVPVVGISPDDAAKHFGRFAPFAAIDCPASSQRTRELLGWRPTQPRLIPDLDQPGYF